MNGKSSMSHVDDANTGYEAATTGTAPSDKAHGDRLGTPEAFVSKASAFTRPVRGASSGIVDPGDIAFEELGVVAWGELHAYMTRRFGPPNLPSDPYKEICRWWITTPMEGVGLTVTIAPLGTRLLFGYLLDADLDDRLSAERHALSSARRNRFERWCLATHGRLAPMWDPAVRDAPATAEQRKAMIDETRIMIAEHEAADDGAEPKLRSTERVTETGGAEAVAQAIRRTLRDLRRTVGVRDSDIGVHGSVTAFRSVKPYRDAGTVQPAYAYRTDMHEVHAAVHRLGGGEKGLKRLVAMIRKEGPPTQPASATGKDGE